MSFLKIVFSFFVLAFFVSCSSGSGDSKPTGNGSSPSGDTGMTTEQAKQRWPGNGSYSTSFSDNGCKDTYDYNNQADYCMALTDSEKSKCAGNLTGRKMAYQESCGDDFEPRNIGGYRISGYDSHLKKQCEIGTEERFATIKKLCEFTKNEDLHKGCFWKERKFYFVSNKCSGDFSPEPAAGAEPVATPSPTPIKIPPPAPDELKVVTEKFAAVGIEVKIQPDRLGAYFPGQLSFKEKLKKFAPVLDNAFQAIVFRKQYISDITLAEFTAYDLPHKSLDLDVGLSKDALAVYFGLLDRRISLEESTGVEIDYGLESISADRKQDPFEVFKQQLEFFISKKQSVKSMSPLIKKIEITSTNFFSPFQNTLSFTEDSYSTQFNNQISTIKSLALLVQDGIQFEGYNDFTTDFESVSAFARWATSNRTKLNELKKIYGGLEIEIRKSADSSTVSFYPASKSLSVYVSGAQFNVLGLNSLMKITSTMVQLGIAVDISQNELNAEFTKCAQLFQNAAAKIATLKKYIKKIDFTSGKSDYYEGLESLSIGSESTNSEIDKLLSEVK